MAARGGTASAAIHLSVEVARLPFSRARYARDLLRVARLAARRAGRRVELDVALLGDAAMERLHRRHLGVPGTTDVLSYPLADGPEGLHGALAVGAEVVAREAARRGHPPYHEACLYAVHGTLHLLGHDDHTPQDRARMRRAERAWLGALGLPAVFGPRRSR